MNNTILIRIDRGDYEVEINTNNIRLTMEELNLLANELWIYSWDINCELVATNDKLSPYWIFGLFSSSNLDSIAQTLEVIIQDLFPNKSVKIV